MKPHFDDKTMLSILLKQVGKTRKQFERELNTKYGVDKLVKGETTRKISRSKLPNSDEFRYQDSVTWTNDRWIISATKHGRITKCIRNPLAPRQVRPSPPHKQVTQVTIKPRRKYVK